jgi:hypothetical protein
MNCNPATLPPTGSPTGRPYRFLAAAWTFRFSRSFFLRWRSCFQRLIPLEPLPMGGL